MSAWLARLVADEEGSVTATEYAAIAAAMVLCLFAAATALREAQAAAYRSQHNSLKSWRAP